jgi:hypothetical protein
MNNKIYVPTVVHYSAVKRNEVLKHAAVWMILESIMLSIRS